MKRPILWFVLAATLLVAAVVLFLSSSPAKDEGPAGPSARSAHEMHAGDAVHDARLDRAASRPPETHPSRIPEEDGEDLLVPYDAERLRKLIADPANRDPQTPALILRAAAAKDPGFQDLPARKDLRQDPSVDLAIAAYDYSVNGNGQALEHIFAAHRAAGPARGGWDSSTTWTLAHVDEWNLTKEVLLSHPMGGDGSAADAHYAFWMIRRQLFPGSPDFPADYGAFTEETHQDVPNAPDPPVETPDADAEPGSPE